MINTQKGRIIFIVISLAVASAALVMMFSATQAAAPVTQEWDNSKDVYTRDAQTIQALRFTSIPYGIESSAHMIPNMEAIEVSGHGICLENTDGYDIRVIVSQGDSPELAAGITEADCTPGQEFTWTATAELPQTDSFEAGPARVDALAIIRPDIAETITFPWWSEVTISE